MQLLVDDMLRVGSIVQSRTGEFEMVEFLIAKLAGEYLELVRNVSDLIPQEAEQFVVHVAFLENFDEAVVVHLVQH